MTTSSSKIKGMLIGKSQEMKKVMKLIEKVSVTAATVLITGDSGTGKERAARAIHLLSSRSKQAFIPVNCAAIPEALLESELFGHEKGAFTGASNARPGRFELANGGTIFLDEIGEMRPQLQVKLLRVLQEREFERVGGTKTIKVDVRILAATNRDLEVATADGSFREDLFYRLNVIPLIMPPLKDRADDIELFMDFFIKGFAERNQEEPLLVAPEVRELFRAYKWPGNVRELENLIERIVILNEGGTIVPEELPERFLSPDVMPDDDELDVGIGGIRVALPPDGINMNSVLDDIERDLIARALKRVGGVKSRAAALLGLNRTTLIEKIKKKNIVIED